MEYLGNGFPLWTVPEFPWLSETTWRYSAIIVISLFRVQSYISLARSKSFLLPTPPIFSKYIKAVMLRIWKRTAFILTYLWNDIKANFTIPISLCAFPFPPMFITPILGSLVGTKCIPSFLGGIYLYYNKALILYYQPTFAKFQILNQPLHFFPWLLAQGQDLLIWPIEF